MSKYFLEIKSQASVTRGRELLNAVMELAEDDYELQKLLLLAIIAEELANISSNI